jgi:hypothetical protein
LRVAVVVGEGFPNPVTGGGALTGWTVIRGAVHAGHELAVVVVHSDPYYDPQGVTVAERAAALNALGVEVVALPSRATLWSPRRGDRIRRQLKPIEEELFPYLLDAERVRDLVATIAPEVVFSYHVEALAATRLLDTPRFVALGDPPHLPAYYRWRLDWPSSRALRALPSLSARMRHQPTMLVQLLRECRLSGAFAAHHAAWLRSQGVVECDYLRTPVPEPVGPLWQTPDNTKPKLLLLGHLRGAVTIEGLRLFASETLPRLERELGADGFETRIVGGYELPVELRRLLDHPSVVLAGHTEDAEQELRGANCVVVPTSIPLGIRVRVITAFSVGCPVVAHEANALGIPELVDGETGLLASSGSRLAEQILRLVDDDELAARVGTGGRATYEQSFAPGVAVGEILARLERVARGRA